MRRLILATALAFSLPASADERFEATLAGHALMPAATMVLPPADAPRQLLVSGRFVGPGNQRVDAIGSLPGMTGTGRPTGIARPLVGQPYQGISGIKPVPGAAGEYWLIADNGFGNRRNSGDAMLMIHRVRPDWRSGQVALLETIFLSDPERQVPFRIANETTEARYLTGHDFDPESLQPVGDGFWIGDEFGPFLIHLDRQGRVRRVVETRLEGEVIRSPDHPSLQVPASPTAGVPFRVRRSGGFEGMALSPDGSHLYPMIEQPLFTAAGQPEGAFIRILEFNLARGEWTGRSLRFQLAPGAVAIGDFNFIDANRAMVIERDGGEGDAALACPQGQRRPDCFANPARVKRVTLIDLSQTDAEGFVRKIGHLDLLAIRDPEGLARQHGDRAPDAPRDRFSFPFVTIESVARVDDEHIVMANDNNLPGSAGRFLTRADDNEMILLRVPEFLQAR
ncbi:esterase-like activity of phytase family protein [Roseomonas frigidaquae]|uniref:Esterase-like activity of phytase family protein n=1 Tax=Falsiroseomonas frigidaquae TaxID=487318 RepID=A0ABX1F8T6_9PROT|nr:esterase-like activity of phytase family protein [Falsiroseomonas frigidaquae]NKE48713.1 esterase-like activity of phytase family protein [Falsiroseomonas frigidaquae]